MNTTLFSAFAVATASPTRVFAGRGSSEIAIEASSPTANTAAMNLRFTLEGYPPLLDFGLGNPWSGQLHVRKRTRENANHHLLNLEPVGDIIHQNGTEPKIAIGHPHNPTMSNEELLNSFVQSQPSRSAWSNIRSDMHSASKQLLIISALAALTLVGCGGGGGTSAAAGNKFAGFYVVVFGRAVSSHLVVTVNADGSATAVITDDVTGNLLYSGTGSVDSSGSLNLNMPGVGGNAGAVTFAGVFGGTGPYTVTATLTGAVAGSGLTGSQVTASPYVGSYALSYTGTASGSGNFTVNADGTVTGTVTYNNIPLGLTGTVNPDGTATIGASASVSGTTYSANFTGNISYGATNVNGQGTWLTGGGLTSASGTWQASHN